MKDGETAGETQHSHYECQHRTGDNGQTWASGWEDTPKTANSTLDQIEQELMALKG